MKPTTKNVLYMLKESNAIEGVYGKTPLVQAHKAWKLLMEHNRMSPTLIRHAHSILMKYEPISEKYKGKFRDVPVWIGGEKKSQPPLVIYSEIADWCNKTNKVDRNFDPVTLHIQFEGIHPFIDGNGRIGRMLLNWHLVKRNKAPLLIYTENDKKTYYRLFSSYRAMEFSEVLARIMDSFKRPNKEK